MNYYNEWQLVDTRSKRVSKVAPSNKPLEKPCKSIPKPRPTIELKGTKVKVTDEAQSSPDCPELATFSSYHALSLLSQDQEDAALDECIQPAPQEEDPVPEWGDSPLQHQWVFYEHRGLPKGGGQASSYHHSMGWVGECSTIAEFWRVFNNIPHPSEFFAIPGKRWPRPMVGSRLVEGWSLFRHGVQPEWEDPKNTTGAELQFSSESLEECDEWWQNTLVALIGGVLPCCDELTGVRVIDKSKKSSKPVYRLELWFTAEADHTQLKRALSEILECQPKFCFKQHSKQKEVEKAAAKAAQRPDAEAQAGRVKDIRALLAKLTPERFERLTPQLRGLLADGADATLAAAVQCIHQCTLQTTVFHSMYADLVGALKAVPGLADRVTDACLKQLETRTEDSRHDAKNAASFAAELCSRGVLDAATMICVLDSFGSEPVEIEVLCTLLTKLQSVEPLRPQLATSIARLEGLVESRELPPRLRFMVQDAIRAFSK